MEQRRFGNTDLTSSALGFGTWEMSTTEYGEIDVDAASRAVNEAIDAGITLFDTAECYGPYHSEILLGKALGTRRKKIVLVTKVGFRIEDEPKPHIAGRDSRYEYIIDRAEGCLRRLGTDWIDLPLIHWPDHKTPYDEPIRAMEDLKAAGKIRHYGVSNFSPAMMAAAEYAGHLAANQVGYNLFDRRVENAVLPFCRERGIGFMGYGTLAYGLLTGAFTEETQFLDWDWRSKGSAFGLPLFQPDAFAKELRAVRRLQELASEYGRSVAQLAIAWNLAQEGVSVTLVGMRNSRELQENVVAADWKLTDDDHDAIARVFAEEDVPTYRDARQAI